MADSRASRAAEALHEIIGGRCTVVVLILGEDVSVASFPQPQPARNKAGQPREPGVVDLRDRLAAEEEQAAGDSP